MTAPAVGQEALYMHPAGPVRGTIARVTDSSVWFTFTHANGNQLELRFTQRKDGKWLQAGKGKYSGQLVWR